MFRRLLAVACVLLMGGAARGLALDLGPVHIHGTDVKVGGEVDFDITVDKITREEAKKEEGEKKEEAKKEESKKEEGKIRAIYGHRKGDDGDKFEVKVPYGELDQDSLDLLKKLEIGRKYKMKVRRMDDDWKLIKIREKD